MANETVLGDGSIWRPLGGNSRRYVNAHTGETLSRRQFDKLSGRLASFPSYEAKAKASPAELRQSRPARGRRKTIATKRRMDLSRLNPLVGHRSRAIPVSFLVFRSANDLQFVEDAEGYESFYNDAVETVLKNRKVIAVQIILELLNQDDQLIYKTIVLPYPPAELPTFADTTNRAFLAAYTGDQCTNLIFRLRFADRFVKQPKRSTKKELKTQRRRDK